VAPAKVAPAPQPAPPPPMALEQDDDWGEPPPWLDDDPGLVDQGLMPPWEEDTAPVPKAAEPQVSAEPQHAKADYPGVTQALGQARDDDRAWYQCCEAMGGGALVRQLALNSVLENQGEQWLLLLSPAQRHL